MSGYVHVVPLGDLIEHAVPGGYPDGGAGRWLAIEADPVAPEVACPCGPVEEFVPAVDGGPDGWVVAHASLDGRERHEVSV